MAKKKKPFVITYDREFRMDILKALGKRVGTHGFILNKNGSYARNKYGEKVLLDDFVGIGPDGVLISLTI